jgi:hypothetical protein
MSGFSSDWLSLREPADHRARNPELLTRLAEYFRGRELVSIADLGTGTGSNVRAIAPNLPRQQHWTLFDHDAALLGAAAVKIGEWAETSQGTVSGIEVSEKGLTLRVDFQLADLAAQPDAWKQAKPDLVTAAALFDLVSEEWIERFVSAVARAKAVFYTALTHSNVAVWSPPHPLDGAMTAAFESHFGTDKGFGPSAGSKATEFLAGAFKRAGYQVERRESPWRLGAADRKLIAELAQGWADAVKETKALSSAEINEWLTARSRDANCVVGHADLLAFPPR